MPRIRALIVDDSVVMRRMISEALGSDPDIEVVGVAANGKIAVQKITQVNPDILTMDVEMPEMDGLETVREIRKTHRKLPIIMFSTLTVRGAESTLEALAAGATDYVTKPANVGNVLEGIERLKAELIPKVKLHCRRIVPQPEPLPSSMRDQVPRRAAPVSSPGMARAPKLLAIGCSTGGPNALDTLFSSIPGPLPVPCVIVQHMPPLFTKMLAERLGRISQSRFFEASEGQELKPGCVYVAPGGRHMELRPGSPSARVHLTDEPPENSCRPAVDVLFRSVASIYGADALALVMTGMGQDGLRGCQLIHERGGRILAQDEASSVVWGMPGFVANAGIAEKILPLNLLAQEITHRFEINRRPVAAVSPRSQ